MDIPLLIAVAIYIASITITYFRGIFNAQIKIFGIILLVWAITYTLKIGLARSLNLEEAGIVVALLITSSDRWWIIYIGPLTAIVSSLLRKRNEE